MKKALGIGGAVTAALLAVAGLAMPSARRYLNMKRM